jgi:hypothetical protein
VVFTPFQEAILNKTQSLEDEVRIAQILSI